MKKSPSKQADKLNNTNKSAYTLAGTCTDNSQIVSVSVGGVVPLVQPTCAANAWSVTFNVTTAAEGAA